ncbi:hypothetical protein FB45DRAFT_878657 [Roridomyces roridus]|uniref:Uncharacterized protein n=1 Tax=Roridomyces roridus TaxID=1738132 RepID=A0AAD7B0B2_9AGAR|nr:hypothetical protein FB45DRAFT_878657 [Roridomyces roridus]
MSSDYQKKSRAAGIPVHSEIQVEHEAWCRALRAQGMEGLLHEARGIWNAADIYDIGPYTQIVHYQLSNESPRRIQALGTRGHATPASPDEEQCPTRRRAEQGGSRYRLRYAEREDGGTEGTPLHTGCNSEHRMVVWAPARGQKRARAQKPASNASRCAANTICSRTREYAAQESRDARATRGKQTKPKRKSVGQKRSDTAASSGFCEDPEVVEARSVTRAGRVQRSGQRRGGRRRDALAPIPGAAANHEAHARRPLQPCARPRDVLPHRTGRLLTLEGDSCRGRVHFVKRQGAFFVPITDKSGSLLGNCWD